MRKGGVQDSLIEVYCDELWAHVYRKCQQYTSAADSQFITSKIILAEKMGVHSHGLHYFLHALLPLLKENKINHLVIEQTGSIVHAEGTGGVGFMALEECLSKTSHVAHEYGAGVGFIKNPGKVGALRVYCQKYMDKGQLVIMLKNTARTMGTTEPVVGTNPLCIGLPDTNFIYDSSMSTVATNKVRYQAKRGEDFPAPVGVSGREQTADPNKVLEKDGYLLPFSDTYWYKSFFLALAIEGMAAMAGGKTGRRVGEHKDSRLYSQEGMMIIIVDTKTHRENYLEEIKLLTKDLGIRLPGEYQDKTTFQVLTKDWQAITEG